tara:strand:+ start:823 stop:1437 length:615 start_codon:yes stop_codon:yes gene_type:complete
MKPDTIGNKDTKLCFKHLIPHNSLVLSAGLGADISAETNLIAEKGCMVVGIDPCILTNQIFHRTKMLQNFMYLRYALSSSENDVIMTESTDGEWIASTDPSHCSLTNNQTAKYKAPSLTLTNLLSIFKKVSYLKMDIEGEEYNIIRQTENIDVPQLSIEFHDFAFPTFNKGDTKECIKKIESWGYKTFDYGDGCEFLFVKKNLL